jgi:hypothetical protein
VLKLSLESFSCLSYNPNYLLVVTVDDWSNACLEIKLAKEVVPPDKFRSSAAKGV